ncbi:MULTISPECIES: glutaredoxin family protein [Prochlorococcus]|uniref:Thioredoxin family protein n=1 Tax=Prochlorococcus marinus (strain SARG / CCMP1375 / SS120) TaxID=167539 RepID=Q7VDG5_PROMA|nr:MULTISPECIES: glutaredoxin family protein [Prochlorococcus]AAP99457.1 Thioredoxin family protein [Prochlorococcus marinus subsp. marinus str. CCMP1375]
MRQNRLILFSRAGCCLCEGLEARLRKLALEHLTPPLTLSVIDIDGADVTSEENARYSLEIPVLFIELKSPVRRFELPRVSPRLTEEGLLNWLKKNLQEKMERI